MEGMYSNLVAQVSKTMFSDEDDRPERLANLYLEANQAEKDMLYKTFICLGGWSL